MIKLLESFEPRDNDEANERQQILTILYLERDFPCNLDKVELAKIRERTKALFLGEKHEDRLDLKDLDNK